ncbi:MAG: hypothetical protein DHS20C08_04740 [Rhodomicrobium sp.]|nr:MAG: hypothetical protein DHS20C08_04740 [Rhodomicrobium sp.]
MTVSATSYAPMLYNGNGATTEFAVTFTFTDSTDLVVTHIDASDTETIWAESTNYTVTGGDGSTGTVTVSTSPTDYTPASGEQLRIERSTPNSQPEDFDFDNQVTEDSVQAAIDRLARVNQELTYNNDRRPALSKAAFASFGGAIEFPAPSAGSVISWNAGGTALVNVAQVDLDGVAISNLTTTASLENSDLFPLYDDSAGNNAAITRGNLVTSVLGSDLEAIKGLTSAANKLPYYTGSGTAALADLTAAGRSLLDDADAGAQRTTLGVTSTTDIASTDNAKGASLIGVEDVNGWFSGTDQETVNNQLYRPVLHLLDQKSLGTHGGTFTAGADQTRALGIEVRNEIPGASSGSNQVTLPAGTYSVEGFATAYQVNAHRAFLYNVTDAAEELAGSAAYTHTGSATSTKSFIDGYITIASEKVFELRHRCAATQATYGMGTRSQFGTEIYANLKFTKVS